MENKEKTNKPISQYMEKTYTYGVIATLVAMGMMIGIPLIVAVVYDIWPSLSLVVSVAGPLLAMYIPVVLAEQLAMVPVAGTTAYINSIMGNVMNLKFPCYLSAIDSVNADPGSEMADVIGMIAVTVSGMVTMIVVGIGVLLLTPLEPILTSETVSVASAYIIPALYGSMGITAFASTSAGGYSAPKKPLIAVIALALVFGYSIFIKPIGNTGLAMLIMLIVSVIISYFLYNKGIVELKDK